MKKNSALRVAAGVLVGIVLLAGVLWLLTRTLGDSPQYLYAGKPLQYWQEQLTGRDPGASNEAFAVVNRQVIPELSNTMLHDTHDSRLRLLLIEALNGLPGVQIYYTEAGGRRVWAARSIGELGPSAKSAVPVLVEALKGKDAIVRGPAILALGKIHSDPNVMIPLLIGYLDDESLNDEAALALANYGSLAKPAVPKLIPMLHASDKDARTAAEQALRKIDPETYTSATRAGPGTATKGPSASGGDERPTKAK